MKKTMMFLGMLSLGLAHAQQGNVGINTDEPKATLEIKPTATNLAGTTNEGIVAPKLSKTRVAAITDPVEGTLVYVTDEATSTIASYTGSDVKVAKIDEKGYYFFNGTEWVKTSNEWVYNPDNKRINLKRSGQYPFENEVFYDENGRNINIDATTVMREANINGDDIVSNILTQGSSFNVSHLKSDRITYNYPNQRFYYASKDESFLQVNDKALSKTGHQKHFATQKTYIYTDPESKQNLGSLAGGYNFAIHRGAGQISNGIFGAIGVAIAKNGPIKSMVGAYGNGIVHTSSKIENVNGLRAFTNLGKPNENLNLDIEVSNGIHAWNDIYSGGTIKNISVLRGFNAINSSAPVLNGNITNMYGVFYEGFLAEASQTTMSIENHYGIKLNNIAGAKNNYAIHTEKGKVSLGDELEVKSTIKVANNTADTNCTPEKAGTIRFDATAKKFQGCTGTEWKDLHN